MQPGVARATVMGILGFLVGALVAIVIRLLQGLDPNPAAPYAFVGPAFVLGALFCSGFFLWGIGAFDPRMSVHGEEAEHAHEPEAADQPEPPVTVLTGFIWQITFWTLVVVLALAVVAFLPSGPAIQSVAGDGNPTEINFVTLAQIYDPVREFIQKASGLTLPALAPNLAIIQVSYLVLFIIFVIIAIVSLFVIAGALAGLFAYLAAASRHPEAFSIPWRAILLALLLISLPQMAILSPTLVLPMPLVMPFYLLPALVLLIVFRHPVFVLLLLLTLALPLLVPSVNLINVSLVFFLALAGIVLVVAVRALRNVLPDWLWQIMSTAVYALGVIVMVVVTVAAAWPDFFQLVALLVLDILVLGLLLPVPFLKSIVPAPIWQRFAQVDWAGLIPNLAGGAARALRGLPEFLGQR